MTVTDQIKILNRKIVQNEAQCDLDIKAAKVSALSTNNLDKYEYLTGEDFGLKPSTVEQAKFEYSPLGKIFNKGLSEDDKKEGLFKRLKNIEKAKKTTKLRFNTTNCMKLFKNSKPRGKDLIDEIEDANNDIDYNKRFFIGSNKEKFNCNTFSTQLNFLLDIFNGKITLKKQKLIKEI